MTPINQLNSRLLMTLGLSAGSAEIVMERITELETENKRLRAIFPKILEALQSGACSPDCSVEFMEQIPAEVAGVLKAARRGGQPLLANSKQ